VLGSAHVVSGLSCWGRVMSDVVGSGWTEMRFLRTVGVGLIGFGFRDRLFLDGVRSRRGSLGLCMVAVIVLLSN